MRRAFVSVVVVVVAIVACLATNDANSQPQPANANCFGLLVGCTEYPFQKDKLRELNGPANDVPLWASLLSDHKGFAFPKENVVQLVGWPDDESKRPTYANIVKQMESLIAKVEKDSRVVIQLSGHGIQVPIPESQKDPLDPKNPEPDGLDELFLPADVKNWTENGLDNAITDNQVGEWLDRLREKGAHVFIVFDCCHSGTMTRGGPGVREISRVAERKSLGISDESVKHAMERAKKSVDEARAKGKTIPGEETVKSQSVNRPGSLVAFYAAQPFEEAPELPFPEDAAMVKENYYGMLSWTLVSVIKNRASPISYGELQRVVASRYRAERGSKAPTPFAEGDLNREVLGLSAWPIRPEIYVEKLRNGELRLTSGVLQGITPGSVLAVHPAPGGKEDPKTVLAYLKAKTVTPATTTVVAVKKEGDDWTAAPEDAGKVPDSGRCEIIERDFGDMRVKLFTSSDKAKAALDAMHVDAKDMIRLVDSEADASWVLRVVDPKTAKSDFGLDVKDDQLFLIQGEGQVKTSSEPVKTDVAAKVSGKRKAFGKYALDGDKALVGALERDLPKVFKWENLWRLAGGVNEGNGDETHGLALQVIRVNGSGSAKPGEEIKAGGSIKNGDEIAFWAKNEGQHDLWVTAFYLDASLGIKIFYSGGIGKGKRVKLNQGDASSDDNTKAVEGIVVFAIPQTVLRDQPNFTVMEQEPMGVVAAVSRSANGLPSGPFGNLMRQAAFNRGTRSFTPRVSTAPAVLSQSWVVTP